MGDILRSYDSSVARFEFRGIESYRLVLLFFFSSFAIFKLTAIAYLFLHVRDSRKEESLGKKLGQTIHELTRDLIFL